MKIYVISIGGAAMHNVALALQANGHHVTGSDDEIYEPSKSRLAKAGLLPDKMGWNPDQITQDIDIIILGMHAKSDNPELIRAQELGLKIYSYPSYVYQHAQDKKRVVVAGSHGKTTTTSMIMHVLREASVDFDYLVGAQLEGFDLMARFSDAPLMIIEGDEYLSSPIDRRPKMLHYRPHIAVLTGIAWDHINVFPSFDIYKDQFKQFVDCMEPESKLFYFDIKEIQDIVHSSDNTLSRIGYRGLAQSTDGQVMYEGFGYPLHIFGRHNMQNLEAALRVCMTLGVSEDLFFESMKSFKGAAKRLQLLAENKGNFSAMYLDFAHAPSKVAATTAAMKEKFEDRKLIAVLELHTFSSLDPAFIFHYKNSLQKADEAAVFYDAHTLKMKAKSDIEPQLILDAFLFDGLKVFTEKAALEHWLDREHYYKTNILLMSSGNFGAISYQEWAEKIKNDKKRSLK